VSAPAVIANTSAILLGIVIAAVVAKLLHRFGVRVGDTNYWAQMRMNGLISLIGFPAYVAGLVYFDTPKPVFLFAISVYFPGILVSFLLITTFLFLHGARVSDRVHNERIKLTAGAFDRLSTILFTVGVATPLAALVYAPQNAGPPTLSDAVQLGIFACVLAAVGLHLLARKLLGGLRDKD
jgi:hypothetical protein